MKEKYIKLLIILTISLLPNCANKPSEGTNAKININKNDKVENKDNKQLDANKSKDENTNLSDTFTGTAGITDKQYKVNSVAILKGVRTSENQNYDRIVFEFYGNEIPSYHIEYIDKPVRQCASGNVAPIKGDGGLNIKFTPAQAHNDNGQVTVKNREQLLNYKVIKEIEITCDFEAELNWVVGVASPNKYRALELSNPARIVIDIKH